MIYLANWSSPRLHGPGRKLSIMSSPRAWEHGDGRVPLFVPHPADLADFKAGRATMAEYRELFEYTVASRVALWMSECGTLRGPTVKIGADATTLVQDGDTLLCCCARLAAQQGKCHRVWVAAMLREAGWDVTLDGVVLP